MAQAQLLDMTRSLIEHGRAETMELTDGVLKVPAASYTDPELFEREKRRIFRRLPLMLAPSCELPEPGDYKAMDVAGVPVLLTRQKDGSVAAFLNMCTHRGNPLAEGAGQSEPLHLRLSRLDLQAGRFAARRRLAQGFRCDRQGRALPDALPVLERAGLIWATLDPKSQLPIEDYLCGYDALLDHFGFADWILFDRRTIAGPNWKTAYDGYLDFYHLPVLHKDTFGSDFFNRANYFAWGPHQRLASPSVNAQRTGSDEVLDLTEIPERDWPVDALLQGVWTIFPHISIASFYGGGGRGALISQLFPGDSVGESVTVQYYVMERQPNEDEREGAREQFDFLKTVVEDEDYSTGRRQHEALQSGLMENVLFGRNEKGGQAFPPMGRPADRSGGRRSCRRSSPTSSRWPRRRNRIGATRRLSYSAAVRLRARRALSNRQVFSESHTVFARGRL